MSAPGPLISFIPVTDAERARVFYTSVLGLEFVQDDGFALVLHSKPEGARIGNMVRLVRTEEVTPAPFTKLGWESANVQAEVQQLSVLGVTFTRYPFLQQDEFGIWTSPNGNKVAWFTDPDGNVLSLSQH